MTKEPPLSWIWGSSAFVAIGLPAPSRLQPLSSRPSASQASGRPAGPGSPAETAEEARAAVGGRALGRHFLREPPLPRPSPHHPPGPARFSPTLTPCREPDPPPTSLPQHTHTPGPGLLNQFCRSWGIRSRKMTVKGGKPRRPRHRTQNGGEAKPARKREGEGLDGRRPLRASAWSTPNAT